MPVRFVMHPVRERRTHQVDAEDVKVVLSRLPGEVCSRLREVHFQDHFPQRGRLGYANHASGALALCALPPRTSFTHYLQAQECRAEEFGASRGSQWPHLAVRRFMLYYVLLHELGHLQWLPRSGRRRGRVPGERMAREFGNHWRRTLWANRYEHSDPVHNPPGSEAVASCVADLRQEARYAEARDRLLAHPSPYCPYWQLALGDVYCEWGDYRAAHLHYLRCAELCPQDPDGYTGVGRCHMHEHRYRDAAFAFGVSLRARRDPLVFWRLAMAVWRDNRRVQCERLLRWAVAEYPDHPHLNYLYADVLRLLGHKAAARYYLLRYHEVQYL